MAQGDRDRMADLSFRMMVVAFHINDFFRPNFARRVDAFGIRPGHTIVDYGCGPGRYIPAFSRLVGESGRVYAVDVHELALEYVKRRSARLGLANVIPVLAQGYQAAVPAAAADVICALDMIFMVGDPVALLHELRRMVRPEGHLILDDGHQPRARTVQAVLASGQWRIVAESKDHLRCLPLDGNGR